MATNKVKTQSFISLCRAVQADDRQSDECIVEVQMQMKKTFEFENGTDAEAEVESKITKGSRTLEKDLKKEKSEHSFNASMKGNLDYKIFKLEATANYSYRKEFYSEVLTEKELTSGEEITIKYKVPAKSKLFRWQLVATVDEEEIGFGKIIDTNEDLSKEMKESTLKCEAVVRLPRKIAIGYTEFRIRHKATNQYLIPVLVRENWDSLTLKTDCNYRFILESTCYSDCVRIKSLCCTTSGWCYVYSGTTGNLFLDKKIERDRTQMWLLSKRDDLRNGDVVTFRNKYYETAGLCHKETNKKTNVFCFDNKEDEWILEM